MPKTTIQLEKSTRILLQSQGKMGESYDSLIIRLLEEMEKLRNGAKPSK